MAEQNKKTNPVQFFSEVRQEGRKVTWPTPNETRITTIMVLIMVLIAGVFFLAVDFVLGFAVRGLLGLFG
jgi:preprotein translocase subunit SecE